VGEIGFGGDKVDRIDIYYKDREELSRIRELLKAQGWHVWGLHSVGSIAYFGVDCLLEDSPSLETSLNQVGEVFGVSSEKPMPPFDRAILLREKIGGG